MGSRVVALLAHCNLGQEEVRARCRRCEGSQKKVVGWTDFRAIAGCARESRLKK